MRPGPTSHYIAYQKKWSGKYGNDNYKVKQYQHNKSPIRLKFTQIDHSEWILSKSSLLMISEPNYSPVLDDRNIDVHYILIIIFPLTAIFRFF
jgi:hypothetical protein